MIIYGKRSLDFTASDGRQVVGCTIWYGIPLADPTSKKASGSALGYQVEKGFISPEVATFDDIPLNEEVDLIFNYKGKIVGLDTSII